MVKIIEGVAQYGNRAFDCYLVYKGIEYLSINIRNKYVLKEDVYIGSSWQVPYAKWKPLGFKRGIVYA